MDRPLNADRTRCYGHLCLTRETCKRYLTMPLDEAYDAVHGMRLRSYADSLIDFHTGICEDYLEDMI